MAKKKGLQTCRQCAHSFPSSSSQCPRCLYWNHAGLGITSNDETVLLSAEGDEAEYVAIKSGPWDACFSNRGGIVKTSVTLLAGAPGGGKSTCALQLADAIAETTQKEVYYVGAEEAVKEIKARAIRLRLKNRHLIRVYPMGASGDLGESILAHKPCAIIFDSINGLCGDDQQAAVEMATAAKDYAVKLDAPVILIGHINKDEDFAGKMGLQHVVDTTISLFPTFDEYREMITVKNRFGPGNVCVPLLMTGIGLVAVDEDALLADMESVDDDDE